ncbi:MAG: tyrosine-type recombinase/integrase [Alistipes sp.]|nr:tyrosine-type recombinase/integrase [Alistipes sp.]
MLNDFQRYLTTERRYSPLTVRNYIRDVERFVAWWSETSGEPFDATKVDRDHLREWIVWRSEEGEGKAPAGRHVKLKAASLNRELCSLRAYFRFLTRRGAIAKDPAHAITALHTPKRLPSFVPETRMETIVDRCRDTAEDFETLRDRLIVVFFYATGLRLAELVAIDVDDFSDDWRSLRVVGKGDKERLVPILDPLVDQILAYRDAISRQQICKSGEKALFLTCKGVRVSRSKVYRVVQKALQEGGVQGKKSPHVLRHTFATHLMNAGADMREIQELMGHSSLQSTQVYTHNSIARLSEIYAVAHPRQRTEKGTKKE